VLKFKCLAKRMSYVKVDCSHLNPNAKRLNFWIVNWKARDSAPDNTKHSLTSICS